MLGITMGDASGVGPEIVLRGFAERKLVHPFVVIGDLSVLEMCNASLGLNVCIKSIGSADQALAGTFNVIDMKLLTSDEVCPGILSALSGKAAYSYVEHAVGLALSGAISALVTLPMNKEATRQSVPGFCGHTDEIARWCKTAEYTMALITDQLVVPHVSAHVSLAQAIDLVQQPRIEHVIRLTHDMLVRLGRRRRIAVLGLNPHAGEHGAFGDEEQRIIEPAIAAARSEGLDVLGPLPADTAFMRGLRGDFEAVVCMYHDQGHAPMKTIGFDDGVNVTVGLPIVRTSVDHGTAFDIAWKGVASLGSFINACDLAAALGIKRG